MTKDIDELLNFSRFASQMQNMENIIPPVSREEIEKELTPDKFIRNTNFGNNELYVVDYHTAPHTMNEIGRLRELTFRYAGGGTGKACDIDNYDTMERPFSQLIVWDPENREILGGYRYFICGKGQPSDDLNLATAGLFKFSDKFISEYLPFIIELGRSFVHPDYQSTNRYRKGMYVLDNLWDGLGALIVDNPDKKYLFGKVTIYQSYPAQAREMIYTFFEKYFPDNDNLVRPFTPLPFEANKNELQAIFTGKNYDDDYKILSQKIRAMGHFVPPLINAYMNLSPSMRTFGTSVNNYFGGVIETGIMITIADIYPEKTERHLSTYKQLNKSRI